MKKLLSFLLVLAIFTPSAFAETTTSVKINNNVNTNSNSDTNSVTNIRIEQNGKVTEYHSDKPGSVEVNAKDGESEIKVNGETVSGNQSATKSPTPQPANEEKDVDSEFLNFIKERLEFLSELFSFFG